MPIINPNLKPRLAVDTSTEYLSIALEVENHILIQHKKVGKHHSDFMIPFLVSLLDDAQLALNDLKLIAYTAGPGSFTGLRIALSVIKGLSLPSAIPLIGIPTLDYIAFQAHDSIYKFIIAVMDARMHEVFLAVYQTRPFKKINDEKIIQFNNPELLTLLQKENSLIISNVIDYNFSSLSNPVKIQMPNASLLFTMIDQLQYPIVNANNATLLYIRNKVALTQKERS